MADNNDPPAADNLELAELRGRMRGRWKAQRREHEREALHEHWAQRTLIDAVRESMDRGDQVAVHLPGPRTLTGHITGVGRDYALLTSPRSAADYAIRLTDPTDTTSPYTGPHYFLEILAKDGASTPSPLKDLPQTFQAVLQQLAFSHQEDAQLVAEIGTAFHTPGFRCRIKAHAGDHLYLTEGNGRDLLLPAATITYTNWPSTLFLPSP